MEKFKSLDKKNKLKLLLYSILILISFFVTLISVTILDILNDVPKMDLNNLSNSFNQTSSIYDENGKLLEKIESLEYRTIVPIEKVPKHIKDAFISIEDERFYKHIGIDFQGIASAFIDNIKAGKIVRGGSTITQQLVKNVYLSNVKTINRKVQEAYLAIGVDKKLLKDEILEAYLNRINLGQGSYGVEAAAQTYFSKDVWDLNLSQSALIAGITKSPVEYPPFKRIPKDSYKDGELIGTMDINGEQMYLVLNPKAFERQKTVLKKMYSLGCITETEYNDALKFDIVSSLNPGIKKYHSMSSYSTDYIKSEAAKLLSKYYSVSQDEAEHKLFTGGYSIYSSIDENIQHDLENIYVNFKDYLNSNTNSNHGAKALSFTLDGTDNILDANGNIVYFQRYNFFDEEFNFKIDKENYNINSKGDLSITNSLFNTASNKLDIIDIYEINSDENLQTYNIGFLNIPRDVYEEKTDYIIISSGFLKNKSDFYKIDANNNLIISKEYYSYESIPTLQPQSSAIILDNESGYVKAIVGGLDVNSKNLKIYNRATNSVRSPGSLIKPVVYLTALENGYTLGSVKDDVPIYIDGNMWPSNDYPGFGGLLTLRLALENNSNVIPVEFLQEMGLDKMKDTLKKFGIINSANASKDNFISLSENKYKSDENLDSLALGNMQRGITNIDAAQIYRTIATGGDTKDVSSVIKIEDANGTTIINNSTKKTEKSFDSTNCYLLTDALRTNVTRGIAKGAGTLKLDIAGEIGLNKFNSDLWFTGYSPKYTISTWIGCDSPKIELDADSKLILNLFKQISQDVNQNLPTTKFVKPDNIVEKYICQKSGNLGTKLCEEVDAGYIEKYKSGTEPTKYCDQHIKLLICNKSNRLASEYCPKEDVEYKIFFERQPAYIASEHGGIYPDDYEYVPKLYCNYHDEDWYNKNKEKKKTKKQQKTTKDKSSKSSSKKG
ncbi:transglycosylase domain-containing protein [Peptoniphilus mikwangii]|uniref:transglycosylase domain-containing protein n=1 Tax=Peptoniphilus mikwangii TaxID=1354300 RepID=UPI000429D7D4|nr:transglycosylase domain-containing protein [Peptoniphilus mikwangii]